MPEPGETRAAHIESSVRDPADALLFRPVAALRARVSHIVEQIQFMTIRRTMVLMFAALVVFLALVAVLEQG